MNNPAQLDKVLGVLAKIQTEFNANINHGKQVSIADLIVIGGCAAVEQATKNAGHHVVVPFTLGRTDATQAHTDVSSFAVLEPHTVFAGKDPHWSPRVIRAAAEMGFQSDENGKMIKPDNFAQLNAEMLEKMYNA